VDNIFAWLVKENESNDNVLWYTGHGVYNDNDECSNLIDNLEALGWEITADNFEPITTDNLENYDIVVIPQLQEGDDYTGGDSTQLLDSEVDNLENFVKDGKGLLVLESSDYGGHNYNLVQNRILGKFDCCCYFQNDQVNDDTNNWGGKEYQPVAWVNANNWIGEAYENFENTCGVNLYSVCSLAEVADDGVIVSISPSYDGAQSGNITFSVVVTNTGEDQDNFTLTVDNQWAAVLSDNKTALLDPWEAESLTLTVTVPASAKRGDSDEVTVTATSESDNTVSDSYYCTAVCGWLQYDVHGETTAYNIDLECQEPWRYYPKGSLPPIVATKSIVTYGRVAAGGFASTCADNQWSENENFRVLMDNTLAWLVRGDRTKDNVLWYTGHGVYYDNERCKQLIDNLKALGWNITADNFEPITTGKLENYHIVVIPQLREGDTCTGGDPTLLLDNEVDNLWAFVNSGAYGAPKSLLVLESSDYGGHNYNRIQNKILVRFDFPVYFQNDEVVDYTSNWDTYYKPVVWVYDTGWNSIYDYYQAATGDNEVGLYGVCSLAESADNDVIVSIYPKTKSGGHGENLTFKVIVTNSGKDTDNFAIEVVENEWVCSLSASCTGNLDSWKTVTVTLTVTVSVEASYGDSVKIVVKATSQADSCHDSYSYR